MTDIWFPTAFKSWGEGEKSAIARVIASDRFTMGEEVEAFEEEFARWHGMRHSVMVNSGSSANLVAVSAFTAQHPGLRKKALVPAIAWATTYAPLVQNDYDLTVADCNEQWNVGQYHGNEVDLQVVCSVLGNPAHFWAEAPWPIIEDNCESLGAVDLKGRGCGTRGVMNTFSFFHSHQLSAIEGGMILTDDDECAKLCRMLRDHGMTRSVEKAARFEDEYDFRLMGYNLRPLEMHAAIAREQLKKLPGFIKERQANLSYFKSRATARELPITFQKPNGEQSPFGIAFTCGSQEARATLVTALRSNGVDCRLPTGGSFLKHAYSAPWRSQSTPNADRIHDTGLFIGCPPWHAARQLETIALIMREAF